MPASLDDLRARLDDIIKTMDRIAVAQTKATELNAERLEYLTHEMQSHFAEEGVILARNQAAAEALAAKVADNSESFKTLRAEVDEIKTSTKVAKAKTAGVVAGLGVGGGALWQKFSDWWPF